MSATNSKKILSKARELQKSVRSVKSEMNSLRHAHSVKMAELNASVSHTSQRILAAVSAFSRAAGMGRGGGGGVEGVRRERLELSGMEEGYQKCCDSTFKELQ